MLHIENAFRALTPEQQQFITLTNSIDGQKIEFIIQSDPVSQVGVNGLQASDILEYVKNLFVSLNDAFACRENALTITKIEEALHWQEARTKDRIKRQVEGTNQA